MNSKRDDEFTNGTNEVALSDAQAALEAIKPYIKPDKTKEATLVMTRIVSKTHSGPIPPAEELEHLDRVQPGLANRIVSMAENQLKHRHEMERLIVTGELGLKNKGQFLAIIALLLLLAAVGYVAFLGDTKAASWLGAVTIIGVVGVFITGRHYDVAENKIANPEVNEKVEKLPPNTSRKRRK